MLNRYITKTIPQVALLFLISMAPALGAYFLLSPPPAMSEGEMTLRQVEALGKEIVWVDARDKSLFEQDHIPDAISITYQDYDIGQKILLEKFLPGNVIVVYCDSGCIASHKVADQIKASGFEFVYILKGGLSAWKAGAR